MTDEVIDAPQLSPAEQAVSEVEQSEPVTTDPGATDPPQEQETDEQKNTRELADRQKRSERAQRGIQKRLDELTADKYEARQRAERAERELDSYRQQRAAPQPDNSQGPKREQYADYESYVEAKAGWQAMRVADAMFQRRMGEVQQNQTQQEQMRQVRDTRAKFESKVSEYAKSDPEFAEMVLNNEDVSVPNEAAALLHLMDDAPQVMKAIGTHPELAARLWGRSQADQAIELGRISASLKSAPQVSTAPAPGKPVGSKPGSASEPPSDPDAYMAWAAKHMR